MNGTRAANDIEGNEDEVLAEAGDALRRVQHLCVEFHGGPGTRAGRLPELLQLLDAQGFVWRLARSWSDHQTTAKRTMDFLDEAQSMLIWARQRDWAD